jgi:Flp pilus assembly protein TadD
MRAPVAKIQPVSRQPSARVPVGRSLPKWLLPVLLFLLALCLYWPAMRFDFVNYDDPLYVTSNVHVQAGLTWENIKWAFANPVDDNWIPLTGLSHLLACQISGLKPWSHHLINILLHALDTVLVYVFLQSLTGARWRSWFVAVLFAVHPLHVESVAWVAERKDVLSGCFGLLALIFYARYAQPEIVNRKSKIVNYLLSLFCLALGLLSKPMLVTWPFVMLLLDFWPLNRLRNSEFGIRNFKRLLGEKIPFFALVAASSVFTYQVQKHGGAVAAVPNLSFADRCGNALISYCRYLEKTFWPTDLAVFYPHPGHWPFTLVLLAGLLLAGISALFFMQRRCYPFLLMGWLWFVGTLVPVIGLVQVGEQAMADRYMYVPSVGLFILLVWGAFELAGHWRIPQIALAIAGSMTILLCFALTRQQLAYWQDSEVLFQHDLTVAGNSSIARFNLGTALAEKGRLDEAIPQFQEALRLNPTDADACGNLATALAQCGQTDAAIRFYQRAIRLNPDDADAHSNLGTTFARQGRIDAAIPEFQAALRLNPADAVTHGHLGTALAGEGRTDEAITQFQEALHLQPDDGEACNQLGVALAQTHRLDEAIVQFQQAVRLQPDNAAAQSNLAHALKAKLPPPAQ